MTTAILEKRETFIVREMTKDSARLASMSKVVTLPDGKRVHSIDRDVFERAERAAFPIKK
jgi:hypothetical protein